MALFSSTPKTVESITAGLATMVTDLLQLVTDSTTAASNFESEAQLLIEKAATARTEADRATTVAEKIKALIG